VLGPADGDTRLSRAEASFTAGTYTGMMVLISDLDGDDVGDVLVGAPGSGGGVTYLWYGPVSGAQTAATADASFTSVAGGENAGTGLAACDVDDDGLQDVLIGAPYATVGGTYSGAVYSVFGESW
jgi:hypothetical protein